VLQSPSNVHPAKLLIPIRGAVSGVALELQERSSHRGELSVAVVLMQLDRSGEVHKGKTGEASRRRVAEKVIVRVGDVIDAGSKVGREDEVGAFVDPKAVLGSKVA